MRLPTVTGEFRAAADPDLRFTPNGTGVANIRAVATSRKKNDSGDWVDDKECWVNITIWQQLAENVVETIKKGDLFFLSGRLETRPWEDKDGNKRTSIDITADVIGPSLTFATADVKRTERRSEGQSQQRQEPSGDPWSSGGGGSQSNADSEPPF